LKICTYICETKQKKMKISIKKSNSTDKLIAVINGRIKVGEVINGYIVPLPNIGKSITNRINHLNQSK
jgi:hypothetical protein